VTLPGDIGHAKISHYTSTSIHIYIHAVYNITVYIINIYIYICTYVAKYTNAFTYISYIYNLCFYIFTCYMCRYNYMSISNGPFEKHTSLGMPMTTIYDTTPHVHNILHRFLDWEARIRQLLPLAETEQGPPKQCTTIDPNRWLFVLGLQGAIHM
jgi:hypothetical protein